MDTAQLRKDWDALKLVTFRRAPLNQEHLQLITDVRNTHAAPKALDALCSKFPITVMCVKSWVPTVLKWAFGRSDPYKNYDNRFLLAMTLLVESDIQKVHQTLFGVTVGSNMGAELQSGHFTSLKTRTLHVDRLGVVGMERETYAQYTARIGALPLEVARPERVAIATPEEQVLIKQADASSEDQSLPAIAELRERKIITPVPLGDMVLMAQGPRGTLHCSSPVPPDGAVSSFVRYLAPFTPS